MANRLSYAKRALAGISARNDANDGILVLLQHSSIGDRIVLLHLHDFPDRFADLLDRYTGPRIFRADERRIFHFGWHALKITAGFGSVTNSECIALAKSCEAWYQAFMKVPPLTTGIERDEDWFIATCPELDLASQGHSIEEAEAMIKEAVELLLEEASPEEIQRRLERAAKVAKLDANQR